MYDGHAFQAVSKDVRDQTGLLIDHVVQRLDACSGPKFLAGDFNQPKQHVTQIAELENRGWVEIQDLALQRWGVVPACTCKKTSRKDFVLLCPELQQHVVGVEVLPDIFPDHVVLRANMADWAEPSPIPLWYVPMKMGLPSAVVQQLAGLNDEAHIDPDSDVIQQYLEFWQSYERQVDDVLQMCQHSKLCPRQKGRATTMNRDFCVLDHCPIKPSRQGEPKPQIFGSSKVYKQWFVQ